MKTLRRAAVVAVVVAGASLSMASAGADQAVPFNDPNAHGFLALCDEHGHAMTGGRVDAKPFVWKAISSFAPPSGYLGKGENAALTIYQPRQGVDPANWNGDQLTGASFFTNPKRPAAQSTYADLSLAAIVKEYPPTWNGLYQLRMIFAKTGYGDFYWTYPATVIKVTGNTWSVVQGGSLSCGAARSVSNESYVGIGKHPAKGQVPPTATGNTASGAASASSAAATSPVAAARRRSPHSPLPFVVLGVALAAAAGVGGTWWWRRRNQALTTTSPGPVSPPRETATSGRTSVR